MPSQLDIKTTKMKKLLSILMVLSIFATSCKKESSDSPIQTLLVKSQNQLFTSIDGTEISSIYLGESQDVAALKIAVTIADGKIGGKVSFSDFSFAPDFVYDTSSVTSQTYFSDNTITLSDSSKIQVVVSNGAISQLIYNGKVYTPSNMNFNQGIASAHEIGRNLQLVPKNTLQSFNSCAGENGAAPMLISYILDSNNGISIVSGAISVTGTIQVTDCGTPTLISNNGSMGYVISFYSDASNVKFHLYQIMNYKPLGLKKFPTMKMVIGDC